MTSKFVQARDAFEGWISHLWHDKGVQDSIAVTESAALSVGKQALTAGALAAMASHASGGDASAVENAALQAALKTGETVGLSVSTETAAKIVGAITASIHTPDAPLPPSQ